MTRRTSSPHEESLRGGHRAGIRYHRYLLYWIGGLAGTIALLFSAQTFRQAVQVERGRANAWADATALAVSTLVPELDERRPLSEVQAREALTSIREAVEIEFARRPGWPSVDDAFEALSLVDMRRGLVIASVPEDGLTDAEILSFKPVSGDGVEFDTGARGGPRVIAPLSGNANAGIFFVIDAKESLARSHVQEAAVEASVVLVLSVGLAVLVAFVAAKAISLPTMEISEAVAALSSGAFSSRVRSSSRVREVLRLESNVNRLADRLENAALLQKQVELAAEVQRLLLPPHAGSLADVEYHGEVKFCDAVGGDIFDILEHDGKVYLLVADVSGHGMAASLIASLCHSTFRAAIIEGEGDVSQAIRWINRQLCEHEHGGRFVTAFAAAIDPTSGTIEWVSAGHEPGVRVTPSGERSELRAQSMPLGIDPEIQLSPQSDPLTPGETLILVTDGIREYRDADGGFFGSDALEQTLWEAHLAEPADLSHRLFEALDRFGSGEPPQDDCTAVVVRVKTPSAD